MKRVNVLLSALLALSLLAVPVSALENANNHPGGPFLYPIVNQADEDVINLPHLYSGATASTPEAPFDALWNSFYSASTDAGIDWDRCYAMFPGEWESHNTEYPDRNAVFNMYTVESALPALTQSLREGKRLSQLMVRAPGSARYSVVLNSKITGEDVGTGYIYSDIPTSESATQKAYWAIFQPASYEKLASRERENAHEPGRAALRLDDSLKRQLAASRLNLPQTKAFSVQIPDYCGGVLFDDGTEQYFQPQYVVNLDPQRAVYTSQSDKPGPDYVEECRVPKEQIALELGRLYPMEAVVSDLERVVNGEWLVNWDVSNEGGGKAPANTGKPVIYLYPEQETSVSVGLSFNGQLTYTYPAYGDGWSVTAYPDGRIINKTDGSEHYYLFWEGVSHVNWNFDKGFCVKGADTEAFLREKLPLLGLTPREYNDFITYWVPKMQDNPYNLIKFADTEYDALASLDISPKPDTLARVHMVYKPLEAPVSIAPQTLRGFERKGFTVVEWGGTQADSDLTK